MPSLLKHSSLKFLKEPASSKLPQHKSKKDATEQKHAQRDGSQKVLADQKKPSDASTSDVKPKSVNPGKSDKGKPVPSKAVANNDSQVNGKGGAPTEKEQPKAKKRKADVFANLGKETKKTKVEEKKPTEADMWFDDVDADDIEATVGTEAADIMRVKQGIQKSTAQDTENALVKQGAFEGLTKAVAMDCEMVGVGADGEESILARVSIVNHFGKCIYDKFVKPTERVTDYRTFVSGIRPDDIKNGEDVKRVQREVADILNGRILVGHAIHNDLKILLLDHPKKKVRDTQKYKPFRRAVKSARPSLKLLCRNILNVKVQQGEHSSVQDAQATMRLYTMVKKHWEAELKAARNNRDSNQKTERRPRAPAKGSIPKRPALYPGPSLSDGGMG
ncbi:RNA exonuclease 4 [Aplochiton taeniatus]